MPDFLFTLDFWLYKVAPWTAFWIFAWFVFSRVSRWIDRRYAPRPIRRQLDPMDPFTEPKAGHNAHVRQWKIWWNLEGRHLDPFRRHPDYAITK
ncbi:hypothetical protein D3C78_1413690 [compost metagenome]